ncbi:Endo-glucanase RCE3 [Phytophthora megakarya]|uniref:Endo-glucanase RCE3 n=1 Tax=Phytophthora megakarya TaxID=4795 RepID=A0A225W5R9_9STRA|nr:Endo-glucanase RCE3 [Phytophthora megakarya]
MLLVAAMVATTLAISRVDGNSRVQLRVLTDEAAMDFPPEPAAEWGQCKWIDKTVECGDGLECYVQNDWYGQCLQSVVDTWGLCADGWRKMPCKAGHICQMKGDWYGQCVPSPNADTKVSEWGQCGWDGFTATCEDNLKCVYSDIAWFGFCVKKYVEAFGQCGGYGWSTDCVDGSVCKLQSEAFSQCIPSSDGGRVAEGGQCKWEGNQVNCADGLQCIVYNDWYGQCVKQVADVWGQCGGKNWNGTCRDGSKCVWMSDWYSQCVPN